MYVSSNRDASPIMLIGPNWLSDPDTEMIPPMAMAAAVQFATVMLVAWSRDVRRIFSAAFSVALVMIWPFCDVQFCDGRCVETRPDPRCERLPAVGFRRATPQSFLLVGHRDPVVGHSGRFPLFTTAIPRITVDGFVRQMYNGSGDGWRAGKDATENEITLTGDGWSRRPVEQTCPCSAGFFRGEEDS